MASPFSFADHVALVNLFLDRRRDIVEAIEGQLLNVQGKATSHNRDRQYFDRVLTSCFFGVPGLPKEWSRLKGQLAATHVADGFEPVRLDKYSNELDPLELIVRAYQHWERSRWPGKSGRLTYADTIFAVFILRQLEYLSLRILDAAPDLGGDRLHGLQHLLDRLNEPSTATVFVRDVRWLIHTAQGPLTLHLRPYFTMAERVSTAFAEADRLDLHKAGAKLAGGHLRSQLRYGMWRTGRPLGDPDIVANTRHSNSMDTALLVRDLVPVLEAYKQACVDDDREKRLDLADAILQGVSADPELFLTRLDVLGPCTMIEDLFIDRGDDGQMRYTAMGEAHRRLLERYVELIGQMAASLTEDAATFDPADHAYSPFGIVYGFVADVLSNMAQGTLVGQRSPGLSLEDVFVSRGRLEDKLARAREWEALPIREGEREHFEHSSEFAAQVFARLTRELAARTRDPSTPNASSLPEGRIYVVPTSIAVESLPADHLPAGIASAQEYCVTSDVRGASGGPIAIPQARLLTDRREGRFLASAESDGTWFGISKMVLTILTSHGTDALLTDVPPAALEVLRLTCPDLLRLPPALS